MSLIFAFKVFLVLVFIHIFANSGFIVDFTDSRYLCWDACWLQPSCFKTLLSYFYGIEAGLRNRLQITIKQLSNFVFGFI